MNKITNHKLFIFIPGIMGFLLYLTSVNHDFVLDDKLVLTNNKFVQEGISSIPDLFTTNYANGHKEDGFNDGLYRPLSLVTFAIEKSVFGLNPSVSHFIQALLYGLLLIGLMLWLNAFFEDKRSWAFWISVLFALHPIHTEVVANLKGRDELLALLFFVFAAWQFVKWCSSHNPSSFRNTLLLYFLALFSKESAVTFIAVFPMIYWYKVPLEQHKWKWTSIIALPVVMFLGIRQYVLHQMGPVDSGVTGILQNVLTTSDSFTERIATAAHIQALYLEKLVMPFNLSHDYSYNAIPLVDLSNPSALIWGSVLIVLIVIGVKALLKREILGFGLLFYFVTISVVANVFILIGALAADRFVFTPSLGYIIAIVSLIGSLSILKKYSNLIFGTVALIYLGLSLNRIPDWKNNYTLFTTDVERVPNSARAQYNAGTAANEEAKSSPEKARELRIYASKHLLKAIEIWPDYQDAYNNLGVNYLDANELENAYSALKTMVKRFPNYSKGKLSLAYTCYKMERYKEAEHLFEAYYNINPTNEVLYLIAECEGHQNKFDEAILHLNELIKHEPNQDRGYLKLGMAYAITGDEAKAEQFFKTGVKVNPNNPEMHMNLALVYLNSNRIDSARESLKNALAVDPNLSRAKQLLQQIN
ncbi:MAG: tetratricopeptide repeat protein [Salibacteraceae bacterium]